MTKESLYCLWRAGCDSQNKSDPLAAPSSLVLELVPYIGASFARLIGELMSIISNAISCGRQVSKAVNARVPLP